MKNGMERLNSDASQQLLFPGEEMLADSMGTDDMKRPECPEVIVALNLCTCPLFQCEMMYMYL